MKKIYETPKIAIAMVNGDVVCFDPAINGGGSPIGTTLDDLAKKRSNFYDEEPVIEDKYWSEY